MSMSFSAPASASLALAATRLLRPLVRLLIRSGMTFPILVDLLRPLFVDVALRDLLTDAESRTDSRISLMTGVHRKEVRRLRENRSEQADPPPPGLSLMSEVIARWVGNSALTDACGDPRPLPRLSSSGEAHSFDKLAASVTSDVRPRAVLDAMIAQDIVTVDATDHVRLNVAAFVPQQGRDEQLFYFGRNLHDHIAAASANVGAAGSARFFDRSVHYDGLTEAQANRLEAVGRELGQAVLLELNRLALAMVEQDDQSSAGATHRINLGIYLFAEDEAGKRDG